MADLKDMTVQVLRDLARKVLGRGHSKLKTRRDLVEALEAAGAGRGGSAAEPARSGKAKKAAARSRRRTKAAEAQPPAARSGAKAARSGAKAPKSGAKAARSGVSGAKLPKSKSARPKAVPAPKGQQRVPARRVRTIGTEPDPDGYMVARVAGEEALRGAPHPMTESALDSARKAPPLPTAAGLDEVLGELPWSYGDDVLVALPRDPTTLFLYWDHAPETLRQAWAGLDGGRPQLRVFVRERGGEWASARTMEFALESRSYYVHDLAPGQLYRAEIHLVDRSGRDVLLALPSNEILLPPSGPSPVVDDRFLFLPWSEPLLRLLREAHSGGPFSEDLRVQLARLSDWSRFAERTWGGWGASAGGMGGRPFSPTSSPSSAAGPWGRPEGKGR